MCAASQRPVATARSCVLNSGKRLLVVAAVLWTWVASPVVQEFGLRLAVTDVANAGTILTEQVITDLRVDADPTLVAELEASQAPLIDLPIVVLYGDRARVLDTQVELTDDGFVADVQLEQVPVTGPVEYEGITARAVEGGSQGGGTMEVSLDDVRHESASDHLDAALATVRATQAGARTGFVAALRSDREHRLAEAYNRLNAYGVRELQPARKAAILGATEQILREFPVDGEFFSSDLRLLTLFALADRSLGSVEEAEFLRHAAYLLTRDHLTRSVAIPDRHRGEEKDPAEVRAVYRRFRDERLTRRLRTRFAEADLLSDTRSGLGLAEQTEVEVEVFALDFDNDEPRAEEFRRAVGAVATWLPPMWSTEVGDEPILAFTRSYAERLVGARGVQDERTVAFVAHEFVHSQGGMLVADKLGLLVEERRAELLSGDLHGYLEVKQFGIYLWAVTGYDILKDLRAYPRDGLRVYVNMARAIGLNAMLEVIYSFPQAYLAHPNESMEAIDAHLDGRDGVLRRLLQREIQSGREDAMNARFLDRIERLAEILGRDRVPDDAKYNLAQRYGLPTMAERIQQLLGAE